MTHRRILEVASLLAASAMALTACSDGEQAGEQSGEQSGAAGLEPEATSSPSTPSPAPTEPVRAADGEEVTPPGAQLAFGDAATVAYAGPNQDGVLQLQVESAVQGSLADFKGFDLDDPYKRRGNYYYVRVLVKNAGEEPVGGVPVPLWGISGENTLLRAVQFKSSFAKCPTEALPEKLGPKDSFKTCLVYLSPDKGKLEGVSYRPTEQFAPIEWRGPVKMLKAEKPEKKKDDQKQ